MINKKEKGFTLVELLAVIVILAIILVIAVPKVMSVIEDSKKATLESTAKMIASAAEKAKVQNTVLGNSDEITCDSVAKINNLDYASCSITFDDNTAKVTIKGSGKFDGLNICNGTKTSAIATNDKCEDNSGVSYIEDLLAQESTLNNGLIEDDTNDKNIRYVGANPNNKVYFNCKDTHNGKSYGSEGYDYASACETWRIIGVFNVKTNKNDTQGTKRIKIVRDAFTGADGNELAMSWDSSDETINGGRGINEWSQADLKNMLNGYYLGTTNTCTYCNGDKQETCSNDCSNDITPLSSTSQNMIGQAVWSTRGIEEKSYTAKEMYEAEQTSALTGKECSVTDIEGSIRCNDTIEREAEWEGKIGLIYLSDWGYASAAEYCSNIMMRGTCHQSNWMHTESGYWSLSPVSVNGCAYFVWALGFPLYYGGIFYYTPEDKGATSALGIRPTLYLSSDVQIIGGNGDDEPFKLLV